MLRIIMSKENKITPVDFYKKLVSKDALLLKFSVAGLCCGVLCEMSRTHYMSQAILGLGVPHDVFSIIKYNGKNFFQGITYTCAPIAFLADMFKRKTYKRALKDSILVDFDKAKKTLCKITVGATALSTVGSYVWERLTAPHNHTRMMDWPDFIAEAAGAVIAGTAYLVAIHKNSAPINEERTPTRDLGKVITKSTSPDIKPL